MRETSCGLRKGVHNRKPNRRRSRRRDGQKRLKSMTGPSSRVTGSQRRVRGLQSSFEKNPRFNLAQAPMASLLDIFSPSMEADSSALAPAEATPMSKLAEGILKLN